MVFLAVSLSVTIVPIRADNDCWWHVKTGQYIVRHGLPTHDVMSHAAERYEWHNHEWLAQIGFYAVHALGEDTGLGGWRALILAVSVAITAAYATVFWLARRISGNWWIALLIVVFAIGTGRRTFYPRPPVISYVIIAGLVAILTAYSEGWMARKRWMLAIPPLFALWGNLHGAWLAGGVIVAAYAAQGLAESWLRPRLPLPVEASPAILPAPHWFALGALTVAATCANPYTWQLWLLPVRVLSDRELVASLSELQSPNFHFTQHFEWLLLGALAVAGMVRGFRPRLGELLIFLFFAHQSFLHVRHLTLFSLVMVPMVARLARVAADEARAALGARGGPLLVAARGAFVLATAACAWVLLANPRESAGLAPFAPGSYPFRNRQFLQTGEGYIRGAFPAAQCDFIELARLEGNMFNLNHYAGYLIWRFAPEKHRVFSDSRFDIFGGDIWRLEQAIAAGTQFIPGDSAVARQSQAAFAAGTPLWQGLLDQYDVQWMLIPAGLGLTSRLRAGTTWKCVALWADPGTGTIDSGWQVWIRDTPENAAQIARAQAMARTLGVTPP